MSLEARLQKANSEFQKLQGELVAAVDARQKLDAQLQENEMVKKVRRAHLRPSARIDHNRVLLFAERLPYRRITPDA